MLQTNVFNRTSTSHKNGFMLFYSDMSDMAACSACLTVIWKKIQNPGRRQILLTYRISGIFTPGGFWWKWGFQGVFNFHWVLFSLFQGRHKVGFIFCCVYFWGVSGRDVANSAKIKPTRKIPNIRLIGKIHQHKYMKYGHRGIRLSETYWSLQKLYLVDFCYTSAYHTMMSAIK